MPRRPRTRADCVDGLRPCPFVGCRYNLGADVSEAGTIFVPGLGAKPIVRSYDRWPDGVYGDLAADRIAEHEGDTCALDVADRGGHVLDDVGDLLGVTRERARQIESAAKEKLRAAVAAGEFSDD